MRIAIIGAGWYGLHLAKVLRQKGEEVVVFEAASDIFSEASSKNQNRLHLGYHYPRCARTRLQSREGFSRFMEEYGFATREVKNNLYAVDDSKSLIDFETYCAIMESSNLVTNEVLDPFKYTKNLSGFIITQEKLILFEEAVKYFKSQLSDITIKYNTRIESSDIDCHENHVIVKDQKFDYLINTTWGGLTTRTNLEFFYESSLVLTYTSAMKDFALTIMDGEFVSLYPYKDNEFTLTSVKHTPLKLFDTYNGAFEHNKKLTELEVANLRHKIEAEVLYYYPDFAANFAYKHYYTSIKTKLKVKNDSRYCVVETNGREIFIFSGKVDTVFQAEDKVCEFLYG